MDYDKWIMDEQEYETEEEREEREETEAYLDNDRVSIGRHAVNY